MDEGLIQFLVIAGFVIISMMDGAARRRRKEAQRLGHMPEANRIQEADDDLGEEAQPTEGIVPEDLWKEIASVARGETSAPPGERPTLDPSVTLDLSPEEGAGIATGQDLPLNLVPGMDTGERMRWSAERPGRPDAPAATGTSLRDLQAGYEHPEQAATHEEHRVRRLREVGPHEPVLHASEASPVPTKAPSRRAGGSRSLLAGVRHGAKRSLRDAIVIAEVLNPPVTLRDSDREPSF
jgi:hypothetical protein